VLPSSRRLHESLTDELYNDNGNDDDNDNDNNDDDDDDDDDNNNNNNNNTNYFTLFGYSSVVT